MKVTRKRINDWLHTDRKGRIDFKLKGRDITVFKKKDYLNRPWKSNGVITCIIGYGLVACEIDNTFNVKTIEDSIVEGLRKYLYPRRKRGRK